jgi:hypothetical protein
MQQKCSVWQMGSRPNTRQEDKRHAGTFCHTTSHADLHLSQAGLAFGPLQTCSHMLLWFFTANVSVPRDANNYKMKALIPTVCEITGDLLLLVLVALWPLL